MSISQEIHDLYKQEKYAQLITHVKRKPEFKKEIWDKTAHLNHIPFTRPVTKNLSLY